MVSLHRAIMAVTHLWEGQELPLNTRTKKENNRSSSMIFLQVVFLPLLPLAPAAAILVWALGLNPSERLTRGILYGCLFLACLVVGHWKFSLTGTGLASKNMGRGSLYAGIILIAGWAFILGLQPPEGLAEISFAIWAPVLC